uniref:NADH dehydrogenase subunit 6 n=1 Tax=Actenodia billbergi TaxID=444481 RepID=UPI001FA6AB05|nr:NADH dehydrogenase subunit 6 [Actenodia billbergi]UMR54792.1 NADH dehydrogenase subunit 6 [Actenodia billbergi]
MMFIIVSFMMSIIFVFLNHPLALGLTLLIQTTLVSIMSGKLCINFWFSYTLFLIMIGGMLILFIYMTSIASNEKFSINKKMIILVMSSIALIIISNFMPMDLSTLDMKNEMMNLKTLSLTFSMVKYTYLPMSIMLMFIIVYLFISLIAIVKITGNKQGPLRPKN